VADSTRAKELGNVLMGMEYVGFTQIELQTKVELVDLTGFNGRCDAIYFLTQKNEPPASGKS
jgi:hypothetical protein